MRLSHIFLFILGSSCTPLEIFNKKCTDPKVEILGSNWSIYKNLRLIRIYSCRIKTLTKCHYKYGTKITSYDISKSCAESTEEKTISSFTQISCNDTISEMREDKEIKVQNAVVSLESDQLLLQSKAVCRYSLGFCYDDNSVGYAWKTELEHTLSCENLIPLQATYQQVVKFTLGKQYFIFESESTAFSLELTREVNICGGKAWIDNSGNIITNDSYFKANKKLPLLYEGYINLFKKQTLYESLVKDCMDHKETDELFLFCSVVVLLTYVVISFVFSVYNHVTNCRSFRNVRSCSCKWLFQSWINRKIVDELVNTKPVTEMEMVKIRESQIYYKLRT